MTSTRAQTWAAAALLALAAAGPALAQASKNEIVETVAVGKTEDEAIRNAFTDIIDAGLEAVVGDEAGGTLRDDFFAVHSDFEKMRKRFFTNDYTTRCQQEKNGTHRCLVEAELKFSALDKEVRGMLGGRKQATGEKQIFHLQVRVPKDTRHDKLLATLRKSFQTYGHDLVHVDERSNLPKGFAITVNAVEFVGFRYDEYRKRQEGGIDIAFELIFIDPEKDSEESIASEVVTVATSVAGTNPQVLERDLETRLITEASNRFLQQVNSNVVEFLKR